MCPKLGLFTRLRQTVFVFFNKFLYNKMKRKRGRFLMQLSSRAEKIIRILARFPHGQPVTAAAISEELGLSRRSVLRELPAAEQWLTSRGFHLIRKPGSGLMLDETPERRSDLLAQLGPSAGRSAADDRVQRQKLLQRELLAASEPVKAYYFTEKLGISEGTLSADLDQVGRWLERYKLHLVRRPGLGIFIEGSETAKRQAISAVVCEQLGEQQLIGMLRGEGTPGLPIRSQFIDGVDADVTEHVEEVLEDCEEQLGIRFSDSGFLSLFVHISLAVQRLRAGETIDIEPEKLQKLRILPEYAVAERMVERLRQSLHISIPADEAGFIAMHLTGARIWPGSPRDLTQTRAINVRQTVLVMMEAVGHALEVDFRGDEGLLDDLCSHIQPMIGRLRAGIPIENPQLESLMADYPDVYHACEQGADVLRELLGIETIPPSETGFLAMHFGAALERKRNQLRRIAVVIVCPTGIGTSRLLAAGLQREYPNLDVRGVMSAFRLDPNQLRADGIELVVSTVELDIKFRYLRVNPILTMQDKLLLGTAIDTLLLQKKDTPTPAIAPPQILMRSDVEFIGLLGREIYDLLDHVRIRHAPIVRRREELIVQAAMLFAQTRAAQDGLAELFRRRDQLADTYIKPFHALLLHGRTALTDTPCFGYVRLDPPFYEKGRVMLGAVVMLIPDGEDSEACARMMSEISGLLLENPALLDAMRNENEDGLRSLLEQLLLRFYKRTVMSRLGLYPGR